MKASFCIYDDATGQVERAGSFAVQELSQWKAPAGKTLRIWSAIGVHISSVQAGVEIVARRDAVPVAGGLIDTTTGDVLRAGPEDRDAEELGLAERGSLEQMRAQLLPKMKLRARQYLRRVRAQQGLFDLADRSGLTSPGKLARFVEKRDQLAAFVAAAAVASSKAELREIWETLKQVTGS